MGTHHQHEPKKFYYTFGPHEPALTLQPGDTLTTTTVDAGNVDSNGRELPPEMRQSVADTQLNEGNPQTGPFVVEGAEPTDVLALEIRAIDITRDYATSKFVPGFGSLGPETRLSGPTGLSEPLPEHSFLWDLDLARGTGTLKLERSTLEQVEIPLHPFLGCMGVAPRFGQIANTLMPAEWGGNMDCVETRVGTTIYLPVFVKGGYFFFGDVHAAQGDGEICGVALETTAQVTLGVGLLKGKNIGWPRLEDETHLMVAASTRPLIDAFRSAHVALIDWLVADYGFDRWEVFQLLSQVGTARVGNVVDPKYTVVAKFPKKYLP